LSATLGLLEAEERNSSYFAWSNSMTSDSTVLRMKLTSLCTTTYSSVEKVVPNGVAISCAWRKVESVLQKFLESMKDYNNSNFNYKREEILKLKSPLYLRLSSLHNDEK